MPVHVYSDALAQSWGGQCMVWIGYLVTAVSMIAASLEIQRAWAMELFDYNWAALISLAAAVKLATVVALWWDQSKFNKTKDADLRNAAPFLASHIGWAFGLFIVYLPIIAFLCSSESKITDSKDNTAAFRHHRYDAEFPTALAPQLVRFHLDLMLVQVVWVVETVYLTTRVMSRDPTHLFKD